MRLDDDVILTLFSARRTTLASNEQCHVCVCFFSRPCRYIPSNFARREKRSLLDKIISKRAVKKQIISNGHSPNSTVNHERILSLALVKFRYDAERYVIEGLLDDMLNDASLSLSPLQ